MDRKSEKCAICAIANNNDPPGTRQVVNTYHSDEGELEFKKLQDIGCIPFVAGYLPDRVVFRIKQWQSIVARDESTDDYIDEVQKSWSTMNEQMKSCLSITQQCSTIDDLLEKSDEASIHGSIEISSPSEKSIKAINVSQEHKIGIKSWEKLVKNRSKEIAFRILECDKDASKSPLRSIISARYQELHGERWYVFYEREIMNIPFDWRESEDLQDKTDRLLAMEGEPDPLDIHVFPVHRPTEISDKEYSTYSHRVNKHSYNSYIFNYYACESELSKLLNRPMLSTGIGSRLN